MQLLLHVAHANHRVSLSRGVCLAIPLDFAGPQPSHFGAKPASAHPMQAGSFVGDTRKGGSCNVPELVLNPHCNGTHTESLGHLVYGAAPVHEALSQSLWPATLCSVAPRRGAETREEYNPALAADDWVITRQDLAARLDSIDGEWLSALVVRTLPNPREKRFWQYGEAQTPPFFSLDAASYLVERGVRHLLVDFPSVDRMYDEGKLAVHRRFWNLPEQGHELAEGAKSLQTITEMIYVPDALNDGNYLLELQIPAFLLDAAPSRPWLYPLESV